MKFNRHDDIDETRLKEEVLKSVTTVETGRRLEKCFLCNTVAKCVMHVAPRFPARIPICDACIEKIYPADPGTSPRPGDARDAVKLATEKLKGNVARAIPRARGG
jgi:hypothetical protein